MKAKRSEWMGGPLYCGCNLPMPPRPEGLPYAYSLDWQKLNDLWMILMNVLSSGLLIPIYITASLIGVIL